MIFFNLRNQNLVLLPPILKFSNTTPRTVEKAPMLKFGIPTSHVKTARQLKTQAQQINSRLQYIHILTF